MQVSSIPGEQHSERIPTHVLSGLGAGGGVVGLANYGVLSLLQAVRSK
jgi:hypothetical protein